MNFINLSEIILLLHLLFVCLFLGGQGYYLFILQPSSYQAFGAAGELRFLQNVLKRQNPFLLLFLCLAVLTGGLLITPLKGSLGANYFNAFGQKLLNKLGVFLLVFFVTAYQTLAIGFKARYTDASLALPAEIIKRLGQVRTAMTVTSVLNIVLTLVVIWLARQL